MSPSSLDPEEEARLLEALRTGATPDCPRCGQRLEQRPVPPRPDVAYVRRRLWFTCGGCGATAVVDRKRIDR